MASVVEGELAGSVLHYRVGAPIDHMLDDLVPTRFGRGEECRLTFVVPALYVSDEFGRVSMAVGDSGVDARPGVQEQVDGRDRAGLDVNLRAAGAADDGTPDTPATRSAHTCSGHQRGDLENVGEIHFGAVRQQRFDRLVVIVHGRK